MKKIAHQISMPLFLSIATLLVSLLVSTQAMAENMSRNMTESIAERTALNSKQQQTQQAILSHYGDGCVIVTIEPSKDFVQGVQLVLRENHIPQYWNGKGDPNTAPVFRRVSIDRFGRAFEEQLDGTLQLRLITSANDKAETMNDIAHWSHPTKQVFAKYGIDLLHVTLVADKTYPIFTVANHPLLDEPTGKNDRQRLFKELLTANAQWDFMITTKSGEQFFIEGKKRKIPKL